MRRWILALVVAGLLVAGGVWAEQTSVSFTITGLPALPTSMGPVRLVDLPHLFSQLPPASQRYLQAPAPVPQGQAAPPSVPLQAPSYQEGNLVACF